VRETKSKVAASARHEALSHREVVEMSQAMKHYYRWASEIRREFLAIGLSLFGLIQFCHAADLTPSSNNTNILTPSSPPANEITHLALFVFCITGAIFIVAAAEMTARVNRHKSTEAIKLNLLGQ
jgi:hypothetical protein